MTLLAAAVIGYFVGAVNPASIVARIRRVDYRSVGSGNPGATNIGRALGPRAAVLVGLLDVLKGFLPALAFSFTETTYAAQVAGIAAVVGHITSPYLRGRGGKGVATSLGAVLAVEPLWVIPVLIVFGVAAKVSGRMGIGSVAGSLTLIPAALVWHPQPGDIAFGITLSLLIVWRHQQNIRTAMQSRVADGPGSSDSA